MSRLRIYPDDDPTTFEELLTGDALRRMHELIRTRGSRSKIFIGWQDECHDQEQGIRTGELIGWRARFDRFNASSDVDALRT
ncbi:MAG: hypothetical protein O7A09_04315 [Proteobacteria bacterium]|nr:hypothetical protein [Pseudomonadota bacterium]